MTNSLYNVLAAQRSEIPILQARYLVERALESQLKQALHSDLIKVITGPRRSGKSLLAMHCLQEEHFGYVNFEPIENRPCL